MNRNYLQLGGQTVSTMDLYKILQRKYPELTPEEMDQIILGLDDESEIDESMMYQKGGMIRNEETEDQDGVMALGQIKAMQERLGKLQQMIRPDSNLEPWVASKITLADDYLNTVNPKVALVSPVVTKQAKESIDDFYSFIEANSK